MVTGPDAGAVLQVLLLALPAALTLRLLLRPPPPVGAASPARAVPASDPDGVVVLLGDGPGLRTAAAVAARHLPAVRALPGPVGPGTPVRAVVVASTGSRRRTREVAAAVEAGLPVLVAGPQRRPLASDR